MYSPIVSFNFCEHECYTKNRITNLHDKFNEFYVAKAEDLKFRFCRKYFVCIPSEIFIKAEYILSIKT